MDNYGKNTIEKASDYFRELGDHLQSTEARGPDGSPIDIDPAMAAVVQEILKSASTGGKVIMIGNGGSASIANHIVVDIWKNGGVKAISFSDSSLLTCVGNDFGYPCIFEKPIEMFAEQGDVLIAISSSGKSENILRGAGAGKAVGCYVVTMSGFSEDNPLRLAGDLNFYVPSAAYGYVEIAHLVLCHAISDRIVALNATND